MTNISSNNIKEVIFTIIKTIARGLDRLWMEKTFRREARGKIPAGFSRGRSVPSNISGCGTLTKVRRRAREGRKGGERRRGGETIGAPFEDGGTERVGE